MSHEITELAEGVHTFLSVREDAWHRLGTTVEDDVTALEAMKIAHLTDWNVRKLPLFTTSDIDGSTLDIASKFATVFTNPITGKVQQLGVVGNHYTPIQNEAHADLLDALVDESGAKIETLGNLRGGRETFITMKMPETMQVGGVDAVETYLVALNSHDGTSAFRFMVTPIRVVCANTLAAALGAAQSTFSIRHTVNGTNRIAEAREALGLTFKYVEAFELEAQRMIEQTMTDNAFDAIVRDLFPEQSTTRAENVNSAHRDSLTALWNESATLANVKGTNWAAYNVVTEYADHFIGVRGKADQQTARATRSVTAKPIMRLKARAFDLLSVPA